MGILYKYKLHKHHLSYFVPINPFLYIQAHNNLCKEGIDNQRYRKDPHNGLQVGHVVKVGHKRGCDKQGTEGEDAYGKVDDEGCPVIAFGRVLLADQCVRKTAVDERLGYAHENREHADHSEIRRRKQTRQDDARQEVDALQGKPLYGAPDNSVYRFRCNR